MKNLTLLLIASIIVGCNTAPKKQVAVFAGTQKKDIKTGHIVNVKSVYTPEFPADTLYPARILTEGIFHADEVEPGDSKREWIGLFKTDSSFYVAPFQISIACVRDEIADEKRNARTGWQVKTGMKDTSILLIAGLKGLKPGTVYQLAGADTGLAVGKPLNFNLNGVDYQVYATGKKKNQSGPEDYVHENYKIFIKAKVNGIIYNQLLVSTQQTDYDMPVLFIGDLDGDNIPDVIIDTADHENVMRPTLYLSKPGGKGQLLKVMGLHTTVGC